MMKLTCEPITVCYKSKAQRRSTISILFKVKSMSRHVDQLRLLLITLIITSIFSKRSRIT
jgi:hypothetical protein